MSKSMRDRQHLEPSHSGSSAGHIRHLLGAVAALSLAGIAALTFASTEEKPVPRTYAHK